MVHKNLSIPVKSGTQDMHLINEFPNDLTQAAKHFERE